jgi:hypothetical protein
MKDRSQDRKLLLLIENVELPDTAYEAATRRYDDLGQWFSRDACTVRDNDPHIFVQGSFALGTAIRPVKPGEEYDLDLTCKLRRGASRTTHSQRRLKEMIGVELAAYRKARNIDQPLESKNRCWRLSYKDELPFHMDVVPAIPAESSDRSQLTLLLEQHGLARPLATRIAAEAVWITDQRSPAFDHISDEWLSSNPEGYIRWFESRMREEPELLMERAQIDEVPIYARKTPLQRIIQLLKEHRDVMFIDAPDSKPISIIISTIAGHAYVAGQTLTESMATVLEAFDAFRRSDSDNVPNPVAPDEDFADKWRHPECRHLRLKENFHRWIIQVNADFQYLLRQPDLYDLKKRAEASLKIRLDETTLASALGLVTAAPPAVSSARRISIESAPRPWAPE